MHSTVADTTQSRETKYLRRTAHIRMTNYWSIVCIMFTAIPIPRFHMSNINCPTIDGFILEPVNPDDEVRLDHVIIPRLSEAQQDVLRDVGYLGGYSLDPNTDEICFKTHVAIRSVLLTANEWEHYMGSGEDLALDQEREVRAWLNPALKSYVDEADTAVDELDTAMEDAEGTFKAKLDLLRRRWTQISEALARFQLQSEP